MKRFWKTATTVPQDGGWGIALDGRPVRTPARAPLVVPSEELAEAIAAEWNAQGSDIDPAAMPMTGIANAAIDLATGDRAAFADTIAAYAQTDLLCYRDDRDAALQGEQAAAWNPLLAWAEARHGIEFALAQGVLPIDQPAATVAAVEDAFAADMLWGAVSLDELYQERRWGADSEAQKARARRAADWGNAARFLRLL